MIDSREELEWFLTGIVIGGNREKFVVEGDIFEGEDNATSNSNTVNIEVV